MCRQASLIFALICPPWEFGQRLKIYSPSTSNPNRHDPHNPTPLTHIPTHPPRMAEYESMTRESMMRTPQYDSPLTIDPVLLEEVKSARKDITILDSRANTAEGSLKLARDDCAKMAKSLEARGYDIDATFFAEEKKFDALTLERLRVDMTENAANMETMHQAHRDIQLDRAAEVQRYAAWGTIDQMCERVFDHIKKHIAGTGMDFDVLGDMKSALIYESDVQKAVEARTKMYAAELCDLRSKNKSLISAKYDDYDSYHTMQVDQAFQNGVKVGVQHGVKWGWKAKEIIDKGQLDDISSWDVGVRTALATAMEASGIKLGGVCRTQPDPSNLDQAYAQVKDVLFEQWADITRFREAQAYHAAMVASHCDCKLVKAINNKHAQVDYGLVDSHAYHPFNVAASLAKSYVHSPM